MAGRSSERFADVHDVVVAHLPGYQVDSVVCVGEGLDNLVYEVNGQLIVRFSKQPDPTRLNNEGRLLCRRRRRVTAARP